MSSSDHDGWTPRLAFWNTVSTAIGAAGGLAALIVAVIALVKA